MIEVNEPKAAKFLIESQRVLQETVQRAWDTLQTDGELVGHSRIDEDFARATKHFSAFISTIRTNSDAALYVAGWYWLTGSTISSVEERTDGMLLRLLDSTLREQRKAIAFIGSPTTPVKDVENYGFCDVWCEPHESNRIASELGCKRRSLGELVRFLTALFVIQYTDEYFWTIYHSPGLKHSLQQAAERCTGFNVQQLSELRKHWESS
jgi:hypothetical protein